MNIYDAISFAFGFAMFLLICWVAWRVGHLPKPSYPEDGGASVADERIDSIRQSLDGDRAELRASDFAALEPHTHIRAGERK